MGISRVGDSGDGLDSLNAGVAAGDVGAAVLVGMDELWTRMVDLGMKVDSGDKTNDYEGLEAKIRDPPNFYSGDHGKSNTG